MRQIFVTPSAVDLPPVTTHGFVASITGAGSTDMTWSVQEPGGGTITPAGLYTSPSAAGTYHVTATSAADATLSAQAVVRVVAQQPVSIQINPSVMSLATGETRRFEATVDGTLNKSVTWSVEEGSGGGSINSDGVYTAPGTGGTYHVRVQSIADPSKTDRAEVRVEAPPPPVSISISPGNASLTAGNTQQFTAAVTGTDNGSVSWSVAEQNGGSISSEGLYTAPAQGGAFHVTARSFADPSKTASATVVVTVPPAVSISIDPRNASLNPGEQKKFTATVQNAADASVAWSVQEADGGSIGTDGTYTAPSRPGQYHVVARSRADSSKAAIAEVVVNAPPPVVTVTILPRTAGLTTGSTFQFTASVAGAADASVVWSADGGKIDDAGLYTAPAVAGAFRVRATSKADAKKFDEAVVTVTGGIAVTVTGTALEALGGESIGFKATVTGTTKKDVIWKVLEGNGGTIAPGSPGEAVYTAPQASGVFTIVATSAADGKTEGRARVTVTAFKDLVVTVLPGAVTLETRKSMQFAAKVTGPYGEVRTGVIWKVAEPDGGSIGNGRTDYGFYSAPAAAGTFHVVATANGGNHGSSTVTVVPAAASISLSISPARVSLAPQATQQFTAAVSGARASVVTWEVVETGGGAITPKAGLYTAPASGGPFHVRATAVSTDPPGGTAVATAEVALETPAVTLSISAVPAKRYDPRSQTGPSNWSLGNGSFVQFKATVTGTSNTGVSWSIDEGIGEDRGGFLDSHGLYNTPPGKVPIPQRLWDGPPPAKIVHVRATSLANPKVSAAVTIDGNMLPGSGRVMASSEVYALWWGDRGEFPSDAHDGIDSFLKGLEGTGYLGIAQQYMGGSEVHTKFMGDLIDTAPAPTRIDSITGEVATLLKEICSVLKTNGITPTEKTMVIAYTSTFPEGFMQSACAWHSWGLCPDSANPQAAFTFAWIPNYAKEQHVYCYPAEAHCRSFSADTNAMAHQTAHEFMETITDPLINSWRDSAGDEIGDKCAYQFLGCSSFDGKPWQIQLEWSNASRSCAAR